VPERAIPVSTKAEALAMLRSRLLELEERQNARGDARESGGGPDVNLGSQIRSYVLHPYSMVKTPERYERARPPTGCLDGDWTVSSAPTCSERPSEREPPDRPTWRRSSPTDSGLGALQRGPDTRGATAPIPD